MRQALLSLFLLMGCETMESSGELLEPVAVDAADEPVIDTPEPTVDAEPTESEPAFEDEEFVISSEELHAQAEAIRRGESLDDASQSVSELVEEPVPETAQNGANAAPVQGTTMMMGMGVNMGASGQSGWPLRLVSTTPQANPPRAILGLPDGREIVVTPGSMVPDVGVVVMAVGSGNLQLAKVMANGDHAAVQSQTLSAQY